jgi:hypothetical protein
VQEVGRRRNRAFEIIERKKLTRFAYKNG